MDRSNSEEPIKLELIHPTDRDIPQEAIELSPEEREAMGRDNLKKLRAMWQFASICQFFSLYGEAFGLPDFDSYDLEEEFVWPVDLGKMEELHARMLRIATKNRFALYSILTLTSEIQKRHEPQDGPVFFAVDLSKPLPKYSSLSLETRVLLLHFICEMQLDKPDNFKPYNDHSEYEATSWRVEPIGTDSNGYTYWVFDDARLYKEKKKEWTLVCCTEEEWVSFPQQFQDSKSTADKALFNFLKKDLVPSVLQDLVAAEEMRAEKLKKQKEAEEEEARIQAEEIARQQEESERLALELEKQQIREERALLRAERFNQRLFEPIPDELLNSEDGAYEPRKKAARRPPPKKTKRRRKEYSDDESEEEDTEETEEEEISDMDIRDSPPPPRVKRGVGRPRKNPPLEIDDAVTLPEANPTEAPQPWNFSCICGLAGQNIDGLHCGRLTADGTPIISCDTCDTWCHILCLAKLEDDLAKLEPNYAPTPLDLEAWFAKDYTCTKCLDSKLANPAAVCTTDQGQRAEARAEHHNQIVNGHLLNGSHALSNSHDGLPHTLSAQP
ncbi:cat eye syndrome chromosome region, candidate 2 [Kappamyces sp. JEL0680]|nr:cat eye syndrome chromosome region, candidate 2 [Kappamyces sp. JEL0680]